jgi:hypothetical protein
LAEFFKFIEGDCEVSAWSLVDWLVSDHVELFLKIAARTGWAVRILTVCVLSGFVVMVTLVIGILCQACFAFLEGLAIFCVAIHARVEDHAPNPRGKVGQLDIVFIEPSVDSSGLFI